MNYLVKGALATMVLYNYCKANENANLYYLRKVHPSSLEVQKFYYNAHISLVLSFLVFASI
jgi:hypothetical protein